MFKKSKIQVYDEGKVIEFNKRKVTEIEQMDKGIFRTEYVRNKFSMLEYVDRLKEVYRSNKQIEKKIVEYLAIENSIKSDIDYVGVMDKQYLYFSIGFFVNKILEKLKLKTNYMFYNYGVFENNELVVAYFDLTLSKYDINFTDFKEVLCKILKTEENNIVFNKNGDIYELILYKKDLITVDFSTLFNLTNFEELEDEGYKFPLIVGKDESCRNTYLDLERNNSMLIMGESGTGKTNMLNLLLMNMISLYSEDEISILMLDSKNKDINRYFAYSPHFIGYHTNVLDYLSVLKEVKDEMITRKEIIDSANVSVWQDLREFLIKEEEYELLKVFPWVVIVVDELIFTLTTLRNLGSPVADEFEEILNYIIENGRRYGIKLLMLAQPSGNKEVNKDILEKVAMKIVFRLPGNTFEDIIDTHYIDAPTAVGEFVLEDKDNIYPVKAKASILGLSDNEKVNYLVRTLTVDMLRGSEENTYRSGTLKKSNNRSEYVDIDELTKTENLFAVKRDTRVFDIANDLLKGRFQSSKYK